MLSLWAPPSEKKIVRLSNRKPLKVASVWLRRHQMQAGVDTGCFVPPLEQVDKGGMVTGRCGGMTALMRVDRVSLRSVVVPAARCHILWRSVGAAEQRCLWNITNYIHGIILLLRHYGCFALKLPYCPHFHIFIIPSPVEQPYIKNSYALKASKMVTYEILYCRFFIHVTEYVRCFDLALCFYFEEQCHILKDPY